MVWTRLRRPRRRTAALLALGALGLALAWLLILAVDVESHFEGLSQPLPTRIYARPLLLQPGQDPERVGLSAHLERAEYRRVAGEPVATGEFARDEGRWVLGLRGFRHAGGELHARHVTLWLDPDGGIARIEGESGPLEWLRIDPVAVGALYGAAGKQREPVALDELPEHLVQAVLVSEDRRFFQHGGLDLRRIAGAFLANLRARRVVQGGSTLTQQLVKNVYLTRERSLGRKLQEAVIAVLVEAMHTKTEILEAYLNEVYLAQSGPAGIHGVGRGARYFFAKPARDLDLAESALIAGILPGPSRYSPHRNPDLARERRDRVLTQMLELERITPEAYEAAVASSLGLAAPPPPLRANGYFLDRVRAELDSRDDARALADGSFAIYTTLDARLQQIAERALERGLARHESNTPELLRPEARLEGALVALVPATGEVLALVGGRNYSQSQFNRATEARRQPGSVFKPVVLLAALSRDGLDDPHFTLATLLEDEPLMISTREGDEEVEWEPANHDREFRGVVTLRRALEDSLNVPMARLGQQVGLPRIIQIARGLGIESRLAAVPSLALGSFEVTLLEMTRAYAVLAAGGRRADPVTTLAVLRQGDPVLESAERETQGVFDPAEVYLVTSALQGAVERGTGRSLRAWGYRGAVAGKTGTTNDYRDAWFIGYTPEIVVGVWVGFDDGHSLAMTGARAALPIFADFLIRALGRDGRGDFVPPPGVDRVRVVAREGHPAGLRCRGGAEVFLAGTAPTERCQSFLGRLGRWFGRIGGG